MSLKGYCAQLAVVACLVTQVAWAEPPSVRSETAALPSGDLIGLDGLPAVLGERDVRRYRLIFAHQQAGDWKIADRLIEQLQNDRLLGHVQAQRYLHPTKWRSSYVELRDWLKDYADHPQAERIHRLAVKRKPSGAEPPPSPKISKASITGGPALGLPVYRSKKRLNEAEQARAKQLRERLRHLIAEGKLDQARKLLDGSEMGRLFDQVERDQLLSWVAAAWFYRGQPATALALASEAAKRSGGLAHRAHWIAGLAAWRLERYAESAAHFEEVARADLASGWVRSGAAYWAGRAHLRLRNPAAMSEWLNRAAKHPRTFYGLLARRALGIPLGFDFERFPLSRSRLAKLLSSREGTRGVALLQVGERNLAADELLRLGHWDRDSVAQGLLALAERANLPNLSFRLGARLAQVGAPEDLIHSALFPVPSWQPESGFAIDRALVFALIRQESAFDPEARNPSGASGLLQLMPKTAEFVAGASLGEDGAEKLLEPAFNLELGQNYLEHLLVNPVVEGDLLKLAAAYNGGPGNLERWSERMEDWGDPLLFVESLPSGQTRNFIERVLANLWIYRTRLGQATPSLDEIAAGVWPRYTALDGTN